MKLTFVKTLQGHEMEFVRLLYPLRYDIIIRILNANPIKMAVLKDTDDRWECENVEELPGWVQDLCLPILSEINENESETA